MKIGTYEIQVPFVPTSTHHLKAIADLAQVKPGQNVIDLGSGNGRVLIEFARLGAQCIGYEMKEALVEESRARIAELGLSEKITIKRENFWEADVAESDIIYIYGMQSVLLKVERKLEKELRPGTKVISNIFTFPTWRPKKIKDSVYLYIKH